MRDKISVIIPVYKVERYLDKCIESVVNQTHKNLEIILVDDGSPDNSPAICDEWAKKDSRIKVIHKENGGVSSARNLGIDEATGEYVCFVDSDDWVEPDYAESLLFRLKQDGTDCAVCNFYICGERKKGFNKIDDAVINFKSFSGEKVTFFSSWIFNPTCNKMYKTKILKQNSIRFREDIHFGEDQIFFSEVLLVCHSASVVSKALYNYNIAASVATKVFWPEMEHYMQKKFECQKKLVEKLGADESVKKRLLAKFALQSIEHIASKNYLLHLKKEEALKALERAYNSYFQYVKESIDKCYIDPAFKECLLTADLAKYYYHIKAKHIKNKIKYYPRNIAKKIYRKFIKKL